MKIIASLLVILCPLLALAQEDEGAQPGTIRVSKAPAARDSFIPDRTPPPARSSWRTPDAHGGWLGAEALYGITGIRQIFLPPKSIDKEELKIFSITSYIISSRDYIRDGRRGPILSQIAFKTGVSVIRFRNQEELEIGVPLLAEINQLRFAGFGVSLCGGMRIMEGADEKTTLKNFLWKINKGVRGELGVGISCDPFRNTRFQACPAWKSFLKPMITCSWKRIGPYQFRGVTLDFQFFRPEDVRRSVPLSGSASDQRDGF